MPTVGCVSRLWKEQDVFLPLMICSRMEMCCVLVQCASKRYLAEQYKFVRHSSFTQRTHRPQRRSGWAILLAVSVAPSGLVRDKMEPVAEFRVTVMQKVVLMCKGSAIMLA
jgi:hypothetical protein